SRGTEHSGQGLCLGLGSRGTRACMSSEHSGQLAWMCRRSPFEPLAAGGDLGFLFVAIVGVVGLWVGRGFASVVGLWAGRGCAIVVGRGTVGRVRAVGPSVTAVGRCIVGREKAVGRFLGPPPRLATRLPPKGLAPKPPTRLPPKGLAPKPPK